MDFSKWASSVLSIGKAVAVLNVVGIMINELKIPISIAVMIAGYVSAQLSKPNVLCVHRV